MNLPKCNEDLYQKGITVFVTHTLMAKDIESFIIRVSEDCGKPVDWHYAGGRAQVLCFKEDIDVVQKSLLKFRSVHDDMYKKAITDLYKGLDVAMANHNTDAMWLGLGG